jgi:chromate transporter
VFTTATFVGYLLGGVPFALVATAGIFVPSFLLVAVVDRVVGRVRRSRWLGPALDGITVAALGLMAGVTVQLGHRAVHDGVTAVLAAASLLVVLRWRPNAIWLVTAGAGVGVVNALV